MPLYASLHSYPPIRHTAKHSPNRPQAAGPIPYKDEANHAKVGAHGVLSLSLPPRYRMMGQIDTSWELVYRNRGFMEPSTRLILGEPGSLVALRFWMNEQQPAALEVEVEVGAHGAFLLAATYVYSK